MNQFGERFCYVGGAFKLTPKSLDKAISITEKELARYQERLRLWHENPGHKSFAHDMEWHGADCIDRLVNAHVISAKKTLEELKSLPGSQLTMGFG